MSDSTPGNSVSILVTIDEWRELSGWMYTSLLETEHSPYGHFLLECEGTSRTWVATDGAQTTALRCEGLAPAGLDDPDERFSVLVNSRFFRRGYPQDFTLTITPGEQARMQTFDTDGVLTTLPEHPDDFGDWRATIGAVTGTPFEVNTQHLAEACAAASVAPLGIAGGEPVHGWLWIEGGKLNVKAPWIDYPSTVISVPVVGTPDDTVPVLLDLQRLRVLLAPIAMDLCTLRLPQEPLQPIGVSAADYEAVLMPADRWGEERDRVETLLCEFLSTESVTVDDDGDYPVTTPEGHHLWVRLQTESKPVTVQVFSVLADAVDASPGLFEELNSINTHAAHVKVIWAADAVMAEVDLVAATVDMAELRNALEVVRRTADRYHEVLSAFFGSAKNEAASDD